MLRNEPFCPNCKRNGQSAPALDSWTGLSNRRSLMYVCADGGYLCQWCVTDVANPISFSYHDYPYMKEVFPDLAWVVVGVEPAEQGEACAHCYMVFGG